MATDILVIGGGPAGIEAAKAAAQAGGRVTLVSDAPIGGRAGWHSLLPSKVWLTAADSYGLLSEAGPLGLAGTDSLSPNPAAIVTRIKAVARQWNHRQLDQLQKLGVKLLTGLATFESLTQVVVKNSEGEEVARPQADAIIIAAGSVPFFPPALKPNGKQVIAPRFAGHLDPLPPDIVVIGAGPTGSEFVYLFNRLGVKVTWIVDHLGVLPTFIPEAGRLLAEVLVQRGVRLVEGHLAEQIESSQAGVEVVTDDGARHKAAMAFVAIGRFPDLSRLNLAATELPVTARQAPPVDAYGRTEVSHIYLVGDAAGPPMIANRATAQAWVAGRHAAGAATLPFNPNTVIAATYTEPQVAQVGQVQGEGIQTTRLPFADNLKVSLMTESAGFIELAYTSDQAIVGAAAVGLHAADVLAPIALAVQQRVTLNQFAALYGAHPTVSELAFAAARTV